MPAKLICPSHLLQHRKRVDIAWVRGYDLEKLVKFNLIPSSYLFEEEQLMTKPIKRIHVQELEQNLSADNYVSPTNWELCQSTFLVDVLANFRDLPSCHCSSELLVSYVSGNLLSTANMFIMPQPRICRIRIYTSKNLMNVPRALHQTRTCFVLGLFLWKMRLNALHNYTVYYSACTLGFVSWVVSGFSHMHWWDAT